MLEEKLTLGEYFRREREKKAIDLKEIEERTKIPAQTLIFLEENQLLAHLEETLAAHEQKNKRAREISYQSRPVMPMLLVVAAVILIVIAIIACSLKRCEQAPQGGASTSALGRAYAYSVTVEGSLPGEA